VEVLAMTDAVTATANRPAWVDLGTHDGAGARAFYSTLFGWDIQVSPDPQYGGYGRALLNGKDVAGIGPAMSPAGGREILAPMDFPGGRMSMVADPQGAIFGLLRMAGA
jgi:predicted enzyme related to lactoylglutathione lyase